MIRVIIVGALPTPGCPDAGWGRHGE